MIFICIICVEKKSPVARPPRGPVAVPALALVHYFYRPAPAWGLEQHHPPGRRGKRHYKERHRTESSSVSVATERGGGRGRPCNGENLLVT